MSGGLKDTSRARARGDAGQPRRGAGQVAGDVQVARGVRPRVGWTQREGLRRLAYALRPLIDQGLGVDDIAAELHAWHLDWRPASPAAYITARLRERAVREMPAPSHLDVPTPEFTASLARVRGATGSRSTDAREPLTIEGLSRAEVVELRSAAAADPGLVLAAVDVLGEGQARRLYTHSLVHQALNRRAQ